ncbi:hypothetical protein TNCV_2227221 [Trichonephila clavipes]|uniref:Uncharacterized protein n=1 Tax=Trichonephila clavipes TaxID=2585209 RepID=A0A8X7BJI0_TRICX|nr:hypothetical protein TNCV_2227221 [Trichonephila clavipes]
MVVSQKVECTVAEGQDVPGTQMMTRGSCNQKSGHFGTNNVASIDSTPLTSFQTSSAIKRNHISAKTLPLTPHHRQCRLFLPTSGNYKLDVSSSVIIKC